MPSAPVEAHGGAPVTKGGRGPIVSAMLFAHGRAIRRTEHSDSLLSLLF